MVNGIKKVYRLKRERIILGVCSGLGCYFNLDPVLIRILFVLFAFAGGSGIFLYIILAFIMPLMPEGQGMLIKEAKIKELGREIRQSAQNLVQEIRKKAVQDREETARITNWLAGERKIFGWALIIFGLIILLNEFFPGYRFLWRILWPAGVVLLGLFLIVENKNNKFERREELIL